MESEPTAEAISCLRLGAFGEFELDEARLELRRGEEVVELEPRPFRLLLYLVGHRDRLVTKQELLDEVWADVAVSDSALSTALKFVRRALGDRANDAQWIESRRGRGYRFIADVASIATMTTMPPDRNEEARGDYVGRDALLSRLSSRVRALVDGRGGAVLLGGPPGVGKSALADLLLDEAEQNGFRTLSSVATRTRGSPDLYCWQPIAQEILDAAREDAGIELGVAFARVEAIAAEGAAPDLDRDPFIWFDAVATGIREMSRRRPTVLLIEDLDEADASSVRLLDHLLPTLRSTACLVIGTFRRASRLAETLGQFSRHAWCESIRLSGLDVESVIDLGDALLGNRLSPDRARALCERGGGNPFFVRELLVSADDAPSDAVCDHVRGRLTPLGAGRSKIVAAASVIGDLVDPELLAIVSKCEPEAVHDALEEARQAVLGTFDGDGRFRFGCPLIREALYSRLEPRERVECHRRLSKALAEESEAGSIHWLRGLEGPYGNLQEASLGHVQRGFAALGDLAPGTTRDQLELELQMSLARALARANGWAGETLEAWQLASELCARIGDTRRGGIVRFGLAAGLLTLGRIEDALHRYDEVMRLGQDADDRVLQVAGCIRGVPLLYLGRLRESASSLRAGIDLAQESDDYLAAGFSEDFVVTLRHWLGWTLWLLGEPDEAWAIAQESLAIARKRDPFMLGYSLVWNGVVALLRDDLVAAAQLAEESRAHAEAENYPLLHALAGMLVATVRGLDGNATQAAEAAAAFVAAMGEMGDSGNRSGAGLMLSFLARIQRRACQPDEAEATIELALALAPETGCFFDAELLRLRGEIALERGSVGQAEKDVRAALAVAREQGARTFEARAEAAISSMPAH